MNKTDMIYTVRTMSGKVGVIVFITGSILLGILGAISYGLQGYLGWVIAFIQVVLWLIFILRIEYLAYRITRYLLSGIGDFDEIFGADFKDFKDKINFR